MKRSPQKWIEAQEKEQRKKERKKRVRGWWGGTQWNAEEKGKKVEERKSTN